MEKRKILILFAHPVLQKSRVNARLLQAAESLEHVKVHKLYEEYPDFHIDIKREQELLLAHDIIVWQHPFYWYSSPPILKEWIDLVLEHGFAYGKSGKALEGKWILQALSSGGTIEAYQEGGYNRYSIPHFLAPFEQTAHLCRMHYLPPFVVHGSHLLEEARIKEYAVQYAAILERIADWIGALQIWPVKFI